MLAVMLQSASDKCRFAGVVQPNQGALVRGDLRQSAGYRVLDGSGNLFLVDMTYRFGVDGAITVFGGDDE